jgi:anthranilate/para-aminobenzoate synthase component I
VPLAQPHRRVAEVDDAPLVERLPQLAHEPVVVALYTGGPPSARWELLAWNVDHSLVLESSPDPLGALAAFRASIPTPVGDAVPHPLAEGLYGYFGYELLHDRRGLPATPRRSPDLLWLHCRTRLLRDRHTRRTWSVTLDGPVELGPVPTEPTPSPSARLSPLTSRGDYLRSVAEVRADIHRGRVFEACLSHRVDVTPRPTGTVVARRLADRAPVPFGAYLRHPRVEVVSASPECFLRLDADGTVVTRPIKGTRPRDPDPSRDEALAADLRTHPKDAAELAMITDLARNDLGRVCAFGSIRVDHPGQVESHPTVHQRVATVRGRLRDEVTLEELVDATFPPGSMTGAPKREAMKVIAAHEPCPRGVYSGALGRIGLDRTLDLSVVIRTLVLDDGGAHFHVGGAIVAESDPDAEHQETLDKAATLADALGATP